MTSLPPSQGASFPQEEVPDKLLSLALLSKAQLGLSRRGAQQEAPKETRCAGERQEKIC